MLCMVWLPVFFFLPAARSLRLDTEWLCSAPATLMTMDAPGIKPWSFNDFCICASSDDFTTSFLATHVIWTSFSIERSMPREPRIALRGSSSLNATSCTFFFPSTRSLKEQMVGSTTSSSSTTASSSSLVLAANAA